MQCVVVATVFILLSDSLTNSDSHVVGFDRARARGSLALFVLGVGPVRHSLTAREAAEPRGVETRGYAERGNGTGLNGETAK